MKNQTAEAVDQLSTAYEQALQLRRTLDSLATALPDMHESWRYLIHDVDCLQRRLDGALDSINKVFKEDPTTYTRPPRWE